MGGQPILDCPVLQVPATPMPRLLVWHTTHQLCTVSEAKKCLTEVSYAIFPVRLAGQVQQRDDNTALVTA